MRQRGRGLFAFESEKRGKKRAAGTDVEAAVVVGAGGLLLLTEGPAGRRELSTSVVSLANESYLLADV